MKTLKEKMIITGIIVFITIALIGLVLLIKHIELNYSLISGLSLPCSDVLCEMRLPLVYYNS